MLQSLSRANAKRARPPTAPRRLRGSARSAGASRAVFAHYMVKKLCESVIKCAKTRRRELKKKSLLLMKIFRFQQAENEKNGENSRFPRKFMQLSERSRKNSAVLLGFKAQMVGNQRDKFGICRLSARSMNRV